MRKQQLAKLCIFLTRSMMESCVPTPLQHVMQDLTSAQNRQDKNNNVLSSILFTVIYTIRLGACNDSPGLPGRYGRVDKRRYCSCT